MLLICVQVLKVETRLEVIMKLCGLVVIFVLFSTSKSESLSRRKRFFNALWPSEEVKSDVQTGLIYAQLPPQYLPLLPGIHDHTTVQRRNEVSQPPARFVHPTRMAILMQPHLQQRSNVPQPANVKSQPVNVQSQPQGPRIVMKPVGQAAKQNPSITLKTREQSLPDIHKNQRFIPLKPMQSATQRPTASPFNTYQQLPIKKSFDSSPALFSVKTAPVEDFYYTKEFQDLLSEFNIKVEIKKLPPISDVMALLGTENSEDTFEAINDVAKSKEGMELIRSYLDQADSQNGDDEFYNYDEDVGAGEIQVSGSEDVQFKQNFESPRGNFNSPQQLQTLSPINSPTRASTSGTLTGDGKSWWKPTTWFGSQSTKADSLKKDAEVLKKVVPAGTVWQNVNYIGKFLTPASKENIPINPPFNIGEGPRRVFVQSPLRFTPGSVAGDTKVLPAVQMTEAQFQEMVRKLHLTPMNGQQRIPITPQQPHQPTKLPHKQTIAPDVPQIKFDAPINVISEIESPPVGQVQSVQTSINQEFVPLPSTFPQLKEQSPQSYLELPLSQQENRRNFISVSEPQRSAPYDFIATGRIHQANPEEVLKKSRSLAETIEGELKI